MIRGRYRIWDGRNVILLILPFSVYLDLNVPAIVPGKGEEAFSPNEPARRMSDDKESSGT